MSRTIAIGDIHGGLKALIQLLEQIQVTPNDTLIFLGDYVDGWSDSAKVVTHLIKLSKKNNCVFIRGNHDDLTENWLRTGEKNEQWLQHGGQSSIDAYKDLSSEEIKAHLKFYSQMINYYKDDENRLFVHAGFTNLNGPELEHHPSSFYWDRTLWETALSLDPNLPKSHLHYPKRLLLFEEIYIGHTPVSKIGEEKPVNKANVWNVDTAAAYKGKISALEVASKQLWQSEAVHSFYPNENGRN